MGRGRVKELAIEAKNEMVNNSKGVETNGLNRVPYTLILFIKFSLVHFKVSDLREDVKANQRSIERLLAFQEAQKR